MWRDGWNGGVGGRLCPWRAIAEEDLDGESCQDLVTNSC